MSFQSVATAPDGVYTASATDTCEGAGDNLVLDYTGPEAPKIMSFKGWTKPYFELELDPANPSNTRWVLERNDAIFTWEVLGAESMALTSDQGHVTTLGGAVGSAQFPLDLNQTHASQYAFTLTATTPDNVATQVVNLAYDETPAPVIHQNNLTFASDGTTLTATISWDMDGADSISISYSQSNGSGKTQLAADSDAALVGATVLDLTRDILNGSGEGAYLIDVEFTNQYGTTTRTFSVWLKNQSGGIDCGDLCA